ncbi:MAG: CapA family protein [Clostridia bacterium]|nr:CapA family protein [Clostridia bacterium]
MKCLFLGDVCPTTKWSTPWFAAKETKKLFSDTMPLFEGNDFNFVNLECALTESENRIPKFGPNLQAPAATAEVLKELGVHCCGLSNNHVFDFGKEGALDTLKTLEAAGLDWTGFGNDLEDSRKNYIVEKDGFTMCVIAVCEHEYSYALEDRMGSRPYDDYDTMDDIKAAKEKYDRVVVIYHGGKEHCGYPSPRLRKLCRAMSRHGADLVLCQHSHCIGCYEEFEGCHILYGQGNFHFEEGKESNAWNTCLAVQYDAVANKVEFTPLRTQDNVAFLAKGDDAAEIMAKFEARNASLQDGSWKQGWHDFCVSVTQNYLRVLRNTCKEDSTERDNANFAHYLDCEAHTDVWRELFPTYNQTNERD